MTDQLIMTTAERDEILHALSVPEHADEGENAAAIALLQSLPMVSGEPVEYLLGGMRVKLNFNKMGNMTSLANMEHDLQGRWVSFVGAENDKHLKATSPQTPTVQGEPVAWLVETEADAGLGILPYTVIAETEHGGGIREMLGAFQVYRKPQALTVQGAPVGYSIPKEQIEQAISDLENGVEATSSLVVLRCLLAQQEVKPVVQDARGYLASKLKCWHRLTGEESDQLAELFSTTSPQALTTSEPLEELLGQYWDIGYKEGESGEPNGDKANEILHEIRMLFKPITPITADDVTDEMLEAVKKAIPMQGVVTREKVVAIYNAVIKNWSEA